MVHQFYAMGSDCSIRLHANTYEDASKIAFAAEAEIRRIELRFSRYRSDSELSRINRIATRSGTVDIDDETAGLINYAYACFAKSDGLFDITSGLLRSAWDYSVMQLPDQKKIDALLPHIGLDKVALSHGHLTFTEPGMELDFGGLGKEYAADRADEVCSSLGAQHGFIDLGGDIRVIGPQPDGSAWRIGIRHPRDDTVLAEIELSDGALATSGGYERFIEVDGRRYCHILNPKTGWPVQGLSSVTVIAERCLVAGSLSTIAMLKGRNGAAWLQQLGVRHIVVDDQGQCCGTEPLCIKP